MSAPAPPSGCILLVDDRPENLTALAAILEPLGHELVLAHSGVDALRKLLQHDVACILLDVQMPDLDGFETAELIKQRERTSSVPIIFLTALSQDEQNVFRGYSAGAVDYMFKPFAPEVLRSKVAVLVELWEKTEQLRVQAELLRERELGELRRESEERYRQLADAMPQIVWTADPDGNVTYFNRRWSEYTGVEHEELGRTAGHAVIHPDDLPLAFAERERTLATGETFEVEYRWRSADGEYRWHLGRAVPIRDEDGRIAFWVGTATDIHERRRSEDQRRFIAEATAILASSLDYRSTLAAVAEAAVPAMADWCAVHVVEQDGTIEQVAIAHEDPQKVVFARELQERYPPDPDALQGAAAVIRTGEPELVPEFLPEVLAATAVDEIHAELVAQLGVHACMCVPLVARERVLGAITFVAAESAGSFDGDDLVLATEIAKRAATAIDNARLYRAAEERAQAAQVLATIGDGVCLLDERGRVRLWNNAAARITGVDEATLLGHRPADAIPGWERIGERVPVAAPGERPSVESIPLELGDRELWLSVSAVGFEDGTVYAFRDLTSERALEDLRQDLVATVSHELRTPLAAIYGAALTLQRKDVEMQPELRMKLLDVVAEESERLSVIVNDLLLASALDSGRLQANIERCDPKTLARSVVEAAMTHLPEGIDLRVDTPAELPPVEADPEQLRQVLTNLVENAIKYSPDGGPVELKLEPADGFLRFAVSDRGLGIPVGEQRRIFEKFYRLDPQMTRGIGGTGLGLYISRELVHRVNGRIWVDSDTGKGSTFFVEIPLARSPGRARTKQTPAAAY